MRGRMRAFRRRRSSWRRLRDTAESFTAPKLSFPSDAPRVKIDYIFTSPDLTVTEADIPALIASDHRPHTATLEW